MAEEIFRISKDPERAKDLIRMAEERMEMISLYPKDKPYKAIEEYYEAIKEVLTAVMYADGYKTLSHKALLGYFSEKYDVLDDSELRLVDTLRRLRNDILYYGKKISRDFLVNNEKDIQRIIRKIFECGRKKLEARQ